MIVVDTLVLLSNVSLLLLEQIWYELLNGFFSNSKSLHYFPFLYFLILHSFNSCQLLLFPPISSWYFQQRVVLTPFWFPLLFSFLFPIIIFYFPSCFSIFLLVFTSASLYFLTVFAFLLLLLLRFLFFLFLFLKYILFMLMLSFSLSNLFYTFIFFSSWFAFTHWSFTWYCCYNFLFSLSFLINMLLVSSLPYFSHFWSCYCYYPLVFPLFWSTCYCYYHSLIFLFLDQGCRTHYRTISFLIGQKEFYIL